MRTIPRTIRPPLYWAAGHLAGGFDGSVWSTWQMRPVNYRMLDPVRKHAERLRVQAILMQLPEVSQLFGVCRPQEPAEVTETMMEGFDPDQHPHWFAESVATGDWLCDRPPSFQRATFLSCRLPDQTGLRGKLGTALAGLTASGGRQPAPVVVDDLDPARSAAARLHGLLGGPGELTPVNAARFRWLLARASRRGIDEPVYTPSMDVPDDRAISLLRACDALLDHPDDLDEATGRARWLPRRHVTIRSTDSEGRDVLAQQTMIVVADLPTPGWLFPGGELFDVLQTLEFPVDWHAHVRTKGNEAARRSANHQYRQLIHQVGEYDGDVRGAPPELAEALDQIEHQLAELAADRQAGEHETTITFQVGAATLDDLERRVASFTHELRLLEVEAHQPRGDQPVWWAGTLPGAPLTPAVRAYRQVLPSSSLAGLMPTASTQLGDPNGMLAGFNLAAGTPSLVFHNPARGPAENRTGSEAVIGGLGSGKSFLGKRAADAVALQDGRFITPDRNGEWVTWAAALPDDIDVQVVEITPDAKVCLDPMRIFNDHDKAEVTLGFLSVLTGVAANSARGIALQNAVHDVADAAGTTSHIIDRLEQQARDDSNHAAAEIAAQLRGLSRGRNLARLVFHPDPAVPPLRLSAQVVVLHAPGLKLPSRETLANPILAEKMLPQEFEGQAVAYLIAAIMRQVAFADRRQFALVLMDEAHALTYNPWGLDLIRELIREARKYNAAAWLISQDAADLMPEGDTRTADDSESSGRLSALLACKWVGRLEDEGAARRALRLLGAEATPDKIRLLTEEFRQGSGRFLHRDLDGNLGVVQIIEPLDELRRHAYDTSPAAMANQGAR